MKRNRQPNQPVRDLAFEDIPPNDQLPREILPNYHFNKLLIIFVGMFVVVAVINFLMIDFLGRYSTNFGYFLSYQKWQLLKEVDEPVDWLILGDSSVNQGVLPSIFEQEFGGRSLNLGTNGFMITLDDLWMMEYYMQRFGPPENVIIVHVYDVWHRDFNPVLLGQIPLAWGFWKEFGATETLVWNREIQRDIFLERYVPIYSQNTTLGEIIQDTFLSFRNPFQSDWQLETSGYFPAFEPMPEFVEVDASDHIEFVSENIFNLSDLNQRAMAKIKALADEYSINVYFALGPQYEGLNTNQNFQSYLNSVIEELSEFASLSDHVSFISEIKTFPADQMQNSDHLIDSGAREYTNWLVEQIKLLR
jgi:hypothetical protein